MKYTSTRNRSISCTFEEAICSGYAPDGGLFVPEELPKITSQMLKSWSSLSYPDLVCEVIRKFISVEEISDIELKQICINSFVSGFLEQQESTSDTIPLKKIGSSYIVELFHGPTFCFKDFGMRALVNILSFFATKRQKNITLIVSTTGDTGPAAVQAVSDAANPHLRLLVHFPLGQISSFQRKQLTTVDSSCVQVATFEGGGDDMDAPIKHMLSSSTNENHLCGVNSYNIGRPLVQMVHFIYTYLRVVEKVGLESGDQNTLVDIILPTGAMGNIAGGYMAKKMGLPIGKLCAGVNINDISHRVIESGQFYKSDRMEKTLSDAINIQVPYNFERLLYYLTGEDNNLVAQWMSIMEDTTKLDLDDSWHNKLKQDFMSARITDHEMCAAMTKVYDELNYCIDPHTAVAVAAANKLGYDLYDANYDKSIYAILSTASPCKFEESVTTAIGATKWNEYIKSEFPKRATSILNKDEIEPVLYHWPDGESLEQVQMKWEELAQSLVAKFSK